MLVTSDFILTHNLYQTEKRALTLIIYQTRREEIAVLKLFQYELIRQWTSGIKAGQVPFERYRTSVFSGNLWNLFIPESVLRYSVTRKDFFSAQLGYKFAPSRIFKGHFGINVTFSCAIGDKLVPKHNGAAQNDHWLPAFSSFPSVFK